MTDFNIPRDRYDRPMLYPPHGEERVGYKRPSKVAHGIDDSSYLIPWNVHNALVGAARDQFLFARIQALVAAGKTWEDSKGEWKNIIQKAQVAGGGDSKADRGTAIHDLCQAAEDGWLDYDLVDEELVPVMESYERDILPEFTFLAAECFVAADITIDVPGRAEWTLRAAGSIDRICEWEGKRYVVDIKSGRDNEFRTGVSAQTFLYRSGKLYRDPLVTQDFTFTDWVPGIGNPSERGDLYCETDCALMFLAPREEPWEWQVLRVPLDKGEEIVTVAEWAAKARYVKVFERVL